MQQNRFAHLETHDTLPKLLRYNARHHGTDVAMREKEFGLWQAWTWIDYHDRARLWALGLMSLGVNAGDVVAIIGDSRPDWVASAIGVHANRALSLGLYQDALESEVGGLLRHAGVKIIVAEDEEQVDKILRLADAVPTVHTIVYCDSRGMAKYDDPRLMARDELLQKATEIGIRDLGLWDRMVDAGSGDDVSVLCTTSGTTSVPKLACLTSGRFLRHVANYASLLDLGPKDEYVSMLPIAWIGEQFQALFQPVVARYTLNFVEEPETAMADMREIAPTFLLLAPRVWEQIAANVRTRIMDASPLKRHAFEWAVRLGLSAVNNGRTSAFAQALVFRALRDRLGFSRLKVATTGGAAMGPDTFKFFMAMGVPMLQLYGQTELAGMYCIHRPGKVDYDTVGEPFSSAYEVSIDNADKNGVGEVVCRHPFMFTGYYKADAATANDLRNGWMHTGDAGYIKPSGQLVVIDRMRDLATTTEGDRFSPQFIENKFKFSPFVSEAVILGDGRGYLSAIVCIRFSIVSKWAEQKRMSFTTYSDLASRREIADLIGAEIASINATLPPAQRIHKFVLLYKELDADDGELTRTRKVRRGVIGERYSNIIEAIYRGDRDVAIDTEIAFQDGTRQRIKTTLPVVTTAAAEERRSSTTADRRAHQAA